MKRRSFLQAFTALLGLGTVAREALALQPESRPESTPLFPDTRQDDDDWWGEGGTTTRLFETEAERDAFRASREPLSFPDRPIAPTKPAVFYDRDLDSHIRYADRIQEELANTIERAGNRFIATDRDGEVVSYDDGVTWMLAESTPLRWRPVTLTIGDETIEIETTPDATSAEMELAIADAILGRKARG